MYVEMLPYKELLLRVHVGARQHFCPTFRFVLLYADDEPGNPALDHFELIDLAFILGSQIDWIKLIRLYRYLFLYKNMN
jgi:hypothetical protein